MREGMGLQSGARMQGPQLCVGVRCRVWHPAVCYALPYHTVMTPSDRHVFCMRSALCCVDLPFRCYFAIAADSTAMQIGREAGIGTVLPKRPLHLDHRPPSHKRAPLGFNATPVARTCLCNIEIDHLAFPCGAAPTCN